MAVSRRIPADRGLTARMFLTGFLLVALYALVGGVLYAVGASIAIVLIVPLGLAFAQYWFSDKIALFGMGGHVVSPEQEPELHGVVDRLCALADMKKPRVAVAEVDMPNAFATGRNPNNAVICATRGIMRRLDEPELEAVLAHELSHVAHRDVAVMTIASFLGLVAGLVTRVLFYTGLFGGFGDDRSGENTALIELGVLLASLIVYAISFLLTMALSRYRELAADRSGAILIGRPSLLASALVKVTGEMSRIPRRDLRAAESFNAFYFTPAFSKGASLSSLFSTHPTLERRLAQLSQLEAEMNQA
ncbi:MAG TPA: zinc metalloprotease HtpX [Acidimicrobiales bacterium]|nr:zinc metalloprotease HtpX [Acidimicrobiales bacterium]